VQTVPMFLQDVRENATTLPILKLFQKNTKSISKFFSLSCHRQGAL